MNMKEIADRVDDLLQDAINLEDEINRLDRQVTEFREELEGLSSELDEEAKGTKEEK